MSLYVVTFSHPDVAGWTKHLAAHVRYLVELRAAGTLRASGALMGGPHRAGMLILAAADRAAVEAIVARDPFAEEGLIHDMTVAEWDPIFGAFNADSSMPGRFV